MYRGEDGVVVLLETAFHDVHHTHPDRIIDLSDLRERGLGYLSVPRPLRLIDLRDDALDRLGLARHQLIATTATHYPCARQWATWLHTPKIGGVLPDGIVWHSRQAELREGRQRRAFVLFGDRAPSSPGDYPLIGPGVRNLVEGAGRLRVDEVAGHLAALIVH